MRSRRPRRPIPQGDEAVFFKVSTMEVVERRPEYEIPRPRRIQKMARFRGTGKAPDGQLVEGTLVDIPDGSDRAKEVVEKGWAEPVEPKDDPARSPVAVANALVRNDPLILEADIEAAEAVDPADVHAKVHLQDPNATAADLEEATKDVRRYNLGERVGETASGVPSATRAQELKDAGDTKTSPATGQSKSSAKSGSSGDKS